LQSATRSLTLNTPKCFALYPRWHACPKWLGGLSTAVNSHSACWADGLMALAGLGSTAGLEGGFSARLVQ